MRCEPPRGQRPAERVPHAAPGPVLTAAVIGVRRAASSSAQPRPANSASSPLGLEPPRGQARGRAHGPRARTAPWRSGCRGDSRTGRSTSPMIGVRGAGERRHQPAVALRRRLPRPSAVASTERSRIAARAVVERVGERGRRMDQLQPVLGEGRLAEERRPERHRMDRRADVVDEARPRQLGRARSRRRSSRSPRRTSTDRPARARTIAAARPLGPEPTTTASYSLRPARKL